MTGSRCTILIWPPHSNELAKLTNQETAMPSGVQATPILRRLGVVKATEAATSKSRRTALCK